MQPRVLLLMTTTTYRVRDFLEAARALGIHAVVGTEEKQALADYTPGETLSLDFREVEASAAKIAEFARENPLAAVLSLDDEGVRLAARAAERLGLPHNPPAAAAAVGDKHLLRQALAAAGVPSPRFERFSRRDSPERVARQVPYPCVLKPLALSASRGVIRVDDEAGFVRAFRRIAEILDEPDARRRSGEAAGFLLAEEYVPGIEVAVEALLGGGRLRVLAIFDKPDPLEGPFFEETIYVTPSRLLAPVQERVVETTRRAVAAVGLREGPVHAELRLNERGVFPIDVAGRSIGGLCSRSLRFGSGATLEAVILGAALGRDAAGLEREPEASGVMMLPIPAAGILREVRGREEALAVQGIRDLQITIPLGQRVVPLPEGHRYLGFLFAGGKTPGEVEWSLRLAHACLRFVIGAEGKRRAGGKRPTSRAGSRGSSRKRGRSRPESR